ncbi:unnamed protein product [Cladocopium goreaui]|uniref:Mono-and diacylglycerol lipase n=1 Tax=Cladocopium goreaui TaxID=2562237 RepID=A0A9P1BMW6_9DINO|nr:unnamed protein product [Cladocopium goreaui]|mmetsp:Transcript_24730/g.53876  ORF Transcript_24730/g.53876 Transcript_24730/m.53876 type:complete len:312 (+) Transcript_24730:62-997(+)
MDLTLPRALALLGTKEIGRVLCTSRDATAGAAWQELLLSQRYILLLHGEPQGSSSLGVWRDLARSIFTGQDVPQHEAPWIFDNVRELESLSSKWRGCPAADLAGVALFKELYKQHEASFGRDPLSTAFYRGHLRALRRSRAMAAVPLTFRWTSADPRSQSCRIGLPRGGTLQLRMEQWDEFFQLHAEVRGESKHLSLLHLSVLSIEPNAPFIMSLLGRKRIPSKWLRPIAWLLPGFDPLPRWWPAFGGAHGGQDGAGGPCHLQMTSMRALLVLRSAEARENVPWVGELQSSEEESSNEPSTTSPSEPSDLS